MRLERSLKAVSAFTEPAQFEDIRKHVDPVWVAESLAATGMAMFRKWPIHDLVGKLSLVLPGPKATAAPLPRLSRRFRFWSPQGCGS